MPSVKIGTMDKKINSTKTSFSGSSLSCKLKEPCSMQSPTFVVQGLSKSTLYNYASFEGRYYWVDDIIYLTNDIQEVHCSLDPLATYKVDIKATTGFINFGPESLKHSSEKIVDSRLASDLLAYNTIKTTNAFDSCFDSNGCVVIRIVDFPVGGVPGSGGVQTLVGSLSDFSAILQTYCTDFDGDFNSLTDFEKIVGKAAGIGNALDSIKSAVYLPFKKSAFAAGGYTGNLGGYSITGSWNWANHWGGSPIIASDTITISLPQYVQDHPWLLNPAFTKLSASTPNGQVDLSDSCFVFGSTSEITLDVRFGYNINGDCFLDILDHATGTKLAFQTWNVALDLKDFIFKAPSNILAGIGLGVKTGTAVVAGIAGAGAALTSVGNAIGSAGAGMESEALFNLGSGMARSGKVYSGMQSTVKTLSNGINGAVAGFNTAVDNKTFGSGASGLMSLYVNSGDMTDILKFNMKNYIPRLITSNGYEDFCNEYGWPVLKYGNLSVNGPYQMAGATCAADAPANALSTINSTINSLIIIE